MITKTLKFLLLFTAVLTSNTVIGARGRKPKKAQIPQQNPAPQEEQFLQQNPAPQEEQFAQPYLGVPQRRVPASPSWGPNKVTHLNMLSNPSNDFEALSFTQQQRFLALPYGYANAISELGDSGSKVRLSVVKRFLDAGLFQIEWFACHDSNNRIWIMNLSDDEWNVFRDISPVRRMVLLAPHPKTSTRINRNHVSAMLELFSAKQINLLLAPRKKITPKGIQGVGIREDVEAIMTLRQNLLKEVSKFTDKDFETFVQMQHESRSKFIKFDYNEWPKILKFSAKQINLLLAPRENIQPGIELSAVSDVKQLIQLSDSFLENFRSLNDTEFYKFLNNDERLRYMYPKIFKEQSE
ncbi:hypothetical protein [Holospora curviuscula]|uniref:Uncharacterized protein n=1 Tax=Holospora curviuscula TaxID=1082868 RepID=A0A2S5R6R5_9PROT|nr:hypothetical protein [Holospora curviuscula]PPE03021.1 hypothetical protein HCUR_01531 [Holospora curviuscula]